MYLGGTEELKQSQTKGKVCVRKHNQKVQLNMKYNFKDNSCIPIQFNIQIYGFKFELAGIIDHHGSTA